MANCGFLFFVLLYCLYDSGYCRLGTKIILFRKRFTAPKVIFQKFALFGSFFPTVHLQCKTYFIVHETTVQSLTHWLICLFRNPIVFYCLNVFVLYYSLCKPIKQNLRVRVCKYIYSTNSSIIFSVIIIPFLRAHYTVSPWHWVRTFIVVFKNQRINFTVIEKQLRSFSIDVLFLAAYQRTPHVFKVVSSSNHLFATGFPFYRRLWSVVNNDMFKEFVLHLSFQSLTFIVVLTAS